MEPIDHVVIDLRNVKKYFAVKIQGFLAGRRVFLKAVDGVSFSMEKGRTLGLIGESGCGKTTLGKLILGLETPTDGTVSFKGRDIQRLSGTEQKEYRRSVQAVFQNPYTSLNPRMRVQDTIAEPIVYNKLLPKEAVHERVLEVLREVGLGEESASLYPHEFSGGQRQRIAVARALAAKPSFIILDEPVSALDVSIRAQILNLLKRLQGEFGIGYLLIAHDLALTVHLSHRIEVLYSGMVLESIVAEELSCNALHPYTKALLEAVSPGIIIGRNKRTGILPGEVPDPLDPPPGCRFHPRCSQKMAKCTGEEPILRQIADGHNVRCHLYQ